MFNVVITWAVSLSFLDFFWHLEILNTHAVQRVTITGPHTSGSVLWGRTKLYAIWSRLGTCHYPKRKAPAIIQTNLLTRVLNQDLLVSKEIKERKRKEPEQYYHHLIPNKYLEHKRSRQLLDSAAPLLNGMQNRDGKSVIWVEF